jgi:hypothetical protein
MTENKSVVWLGGLAVAAGLGVAVGGAAAASADTGTAGPAQPSKADQAHSARNGPANRVKAGPANRVKVGPVKGATAKSASAGQTNSPRVAAAPLAAASVPSSVRSAVALAPTTAALSAPVTSDVSAISRATAAANPIQQLVSGVVKLFQQILSIPQKIIAQISKLFGGSGSSQGSGNYKVSGTVPLSAGHGAVPPPIAVGSDGRIYALSLTYSAGGSTTGAELQVYDPAAGGTYTTVALDPNQFTYSSSSTGSYNIVAGVGGDTNVYITGVAAADRTVIAISNTGVVKTISLGATSDVALVASTTGIYAASTSLDGGVYKPTLWTIDPSAGTAAKAILGSFIVSSALAYRDGPALAGGPNGAVYVIGYLTNSTQGVATVGAGGAVGTPVVISNTTFYLNGTRFVADAAHVYSARSTINTTSGAVSSNALGLGTNGVATHVAIGSDGLVYINAYDSTAAGPSNGAVKVFNPATGKTVATVKLGGYVSTVGTGNAKVYALRSDSTGKYFVDVISKSS